MSLLKSLFFDHSWMYIKRGDVAACRCLYLVMPEERPSVRVLTRTLGRSSSTTKYSDTSANECFSGCAR
jgi:hypothetical protein